ncbi:FAD-dependent oxidoreductase [Bordetella bronchialis]|uniref:Fumarate reductase n=1 Tax=Bordetella bronchialis TaxID=463025 RepID=A0ABN4R1B1_9BORD|nr:FAD-dependent oxidoreductase [Bordetella bronchialis]ANN67064.1 fumarate reductase [Bordetella bronchialis]
MVAHQEPPGGGSRFDVVVVGCGVAGLSAAVAAAEAGAKVALLERSTYEERGGNTRYTEAYLRMKSETELAHDFESLLVDNSGYYIQPDFAESTVRDYENWSPVVKALPFTDPELISTFTDSVPPAIAWLKAHGVTFGEAGFYGLTPRPSPRIAVNGGGLQLVETLTGCAERAGVRFFYEMTAYELVQSDSGQVCGLKATDTANVPHRFDCGAVILACGGFQGNPEMVIRYIGPKGRYLRPVAPGGYYNKGEGIKMALAIGAAASGDYAEYHGQPIDPRSSASEALVMVYPYGILVNREGRRFIDEAPGTIDAHYEETIRLIAEQKKGIAYCILDDKINRIGNWKRCVRSDQPPESGSDLVALGRKMGFDGEAAQRTIDEYNRACGGGDFNPATLDGVATAGLSPRKSNYAVPLDTPPFHIYPIISANTFTLGGLKVNSNAQVIKNEGCVLPGLYAAGETIGLYYGRYPGATSVLRGAVFGRRAGEHAAASVR